MKKEKMIWAITSMVIWLWAPIHINAQRDSLSVRQLDEVIVTATKFPKSASETGKVLTIIDAEMISRSAGKDIVQLLNDQVGMVVSGANSNPGKDKSVYLRGAKNEYTLILIDGVPLNDPSGISGGAYDLRLISLEQVERIEILKGSQSTLYGSDAIAGVVNIITKKNINKPVEFSGTLGLGSYHSGRTNAGISGTLKNIGYAVSYSGYTTAGISEAAERGNTSFDKDGAAQNAFQTSLDIRPSAKLSVKPFFRYTTFDGKYDGGAYTDDTLNVYSATLINSGAMANYALEKGGVNFQYSYNESNRTYDGTYGKNDYLGKFHHTELFSNYGISKHLEVLAGMAYQQYTMIDKTAVEPDPSVKIASPYVSLFNTYGNFTAEVGGRYNHHSNFGSHFTYSINPSYRFENGIKIFFNSSTGFKAPSLYQLYGLYGANPDLKPEKSRSNEAGGQWLSSSGKWELRAVVFSRKISDVIVYVYPTNVNLDTQNDHGVELEATFNANQKVSLKGFYSFVDGNVTTKTAGKDSTYYNLFRRPKHTIGINVQYQLSSRTLVSMNARYFGNRSDLYFDSETFTNQTATLAAYSLADLYAEHRITKIKSTFFVDIRNLLNTSYQEAYGYATMGINIFGGLRVKL